MGGKGSGGFRVGSGRKPKALAAHLLQGTTPGHVRPTGPPPPTEPVAAPADLPAEALTIWQQLAPHAFIARTLTPATAYAFGLLCRNIVLERQLATAVAKRGSNDHRNLIQRVDAELVRFCLAPIGKALWEPAPATEDPFAEFDRGVH